jgi:hypothetical protein
MVGTVDGESNVLVGEVQGRNNTITGIATEKDNNASSHTNVWDVPPTASAPLHTPTSYGSAEHTSIPHAPDTASAWPTPALHGPPEPTSIPHVPETASAQPTPALHGPPETRMEILTAWGDKIDLKVLFDKGSASRSAFFGPLLDNSTIYSSFNVLGNSAPIQEIAIVSHHAHKYTVCIPKASMHMPILNRLSGMESWRTSRGVF